MGIPQIALLAGVQAGMIAVIKAWPDSDHAAFGRRSGASFTLACVTM